MNGTLALLDPWFLLAIPVVIALVVARVLRERAALPAPTLALLEGLPVTFRERLVRLPLLLHALAAVALGVALARPVSRELLPLRELGVDIMLAIDLSSSMRAPDMDESKPVTRIEAARNKALEFVKSRKRDRVALLTFAHYPDLRCPPTLDQDALAQYLRGLKTVEPGSAEDRTGIGVGLAQAVKLLEKSKAKSRIVVILSDGEDNIPAFPYLDAAKLAKDAGIRVHTIGVGNGERTPFGGVHKLTFEALQKIAEATGGRFFRAESQDELAQTYGEIDRMEKVELEDPRYRTSELFLWPAAAAAALFVLGALLRVAGLGGVP
jgi:Ca-activated chloride channel family protein